MKNEVTKELKEKKSESLTKQNISESWFRYWLAAEVSNSYERLQSLSFCYSLLPILKKIYPDQQDLGAAIQRELVFFNTEPTWGSPILGITIAMEEEKAKGADIPDSAITGIKTGLMGPLAGIGDTIDWGTLKTIIYGIAVTFAVTGNFVGGIIPIAFTILTFFIGLSLCKMGYTLGKESVESILEQGWIKDLIFGTSILGLFMMGALTSSFVKITTPLKFKIADGSVIILQKILDSIAPGLLPLAAVFIIYYLLKKGKVNYGFLAVGIVVVCLIASFIGVL